MDQQRLVREVNELQQDWPVKWSLDKQYVMITKYGYPQGWSPRTAPLFFSLPDVYPRQPPDVFLPPDMRYKGSTVIHQLSPNDDGWFKWCIEELDWKPRHHRLMTMVELMNRSLTKPYQNRIVK
jgi:hypothetical protein